MERSAGHFRARLNEGTAHGAWSPRVGVCIGLSPFAPSDESPADSPSPLQSNTSRTNLLLKSRLQKFSLVNLSAARSKWGRYDKQYMHARRVLGLTLPMRLECATAALLLAMPNMRCLSCSQSEILGAIAVS